MSEREVGNGRRAVPPLLPATRERAGQAVITLSEPESDPLASRVFDGAAYLAGLWQNLAREVPPPAPPRPAQQTPRERVRYGYD